MGVLEHFRSYHDRMRAKFRKDHANEIERVKTVDEFLREVVEKNDFSMCIKLDAFQKAVADNSFKSMAETSYGTTIGGIDTRKQVVSTLFDVNADKLAPEEFPKYGLLTGKDKRKDLISYDDVFYHFGQILVTFKKENLMKRTTMTVGSSVNFGEFFRKVPVFVDDPNALALTGSVDKNPNLKMKISTVSTLFIPFSSWKSSILSFLTASQRFLKGVSALNTTNSSFSANSPWMMSRGSIITSSKGTKKRSSTK